VPTDKGYRFFVDTLTPRGVLQPAQSHQVRTFFARAHGELERMLADTSRLLSTLTGSAAVVVGPSQEVATVRSVQLVGLGGRVALAVIVLSNGTVEKRSIEIAEDTRGVGASEPGAGRDRVGPAVPGRPHPRSGGRRAHHPGHRQLRRRRSVCR
jgi:heat-inducible transcriptional repressor